MRNLRTVVPAFATVLAVAVGGSAFALAGAGPATSATSAGAPAASGPAAGLLAGSYQPEFGRLSVAGKSRIVSRRAPEVVGQARLGRTLTVTSGTWRPARVQLTYSWFLDAEKIRGAKRASYTPTAADVGGVVSVRVVASRTGYRPATVDSSAGMVKGGTLRSVSAPVIRGSAEVGERLSVTPGKWSAPGVRVSYAWMKGRTVLSTSSRYVVQRDDRGKKLAVEVRATKPGYRAATVTTAPTAKVRR